MRMLKASGTQSKRNEKDAYHNHGHYFSSKAEDAAHDEIAERALMKQKMIAKKKARAKLERIRLMKEIDLY